MRFTSEKVAGITAIIICFSAPAIMAQQNWDDHDRSNRFFSVDSAKNFLASTAENSILFTGGDNDTFPLWYVQDVEGFRTDSRVVVLSYFNTDWYIEQMMRKAYESEPFPFTLTLENYRSGGLNDYLPYEDMGMSSIDARQYIELLKNEDPRLKLYPTANIVPSRTFVLRVDKEKVKSLGIIPEGMDSLIVDQMVINMKQGRNGLEKKDLAILDMLVTNDWSRPIYLNNTSREQISFDLSPYAIQEGNAFRILPIRNPVPNNPFVSTDVMYRNLTENFHFRELDNPGVYYNEDYRNFVLNHRSSFNNLAAALIEEERIDKAAELLKFSLEKMPDASVPYDYTTPRTVSLLFIAGEDELATEIGQVVGDRAIEMVNYLVRERIPIGYELQSNLVILGELQRTMLLNGKSDLAEKYQEAYETAVGTYQNLRDNM
jgi:hypothetical protein